MKDLSFLLLKNSLGSKMRRGFRSFCNGDASTSTLNQHKTMAEATTPDDQYTYHGDGESSSLLIGSSTTTTTNLLDKESRPPTLEEMILQLEVEEEIARKAKLREYYGTRTETQQQRRMSCVNNSDILRSARNALNQYPRFSLDGKDAMYRSSFRNLQAQAPGRKSICCNVRGRGSRCYSYADEFESKSKSAKLEKRRTTSSSCLPATVAGESVIWCKPGVVAKLMGLEVMPVPVPVPLVSTSTSRDKHYLNNSRQNLIRRRAQKSHEEMERRSRSSSTTVMDMKNGCSCSAMAGTRAASSSKGRYRVMRPLALAPQLPNNNNNNNIDGVGWPIAHFL